MLNVFGAQRCDNKQGSCSDLCCVHGKDDGQQDPYIKSLIDRDQSSKTFVNKILLLF